MSHQQLFLGQPRSHRGFVYRIWGVRKQYRYVIFNDDGDRLIVSELFSQVVEANQTCHKHINWVKRMAEANRQRHPEPTEGWQVSCGRWSFKIVPERDEALETVHSLATFFNGVVISGEVPDADAP